MEPRRTTSARALAAVVLCSLVAAPTLAGPLTVAPDVSSVHIMSRDKTLFGRLFSPALETPTSKAPSVFMLHGIPGTEQNFDVAYALRDVGFNCLLWHYRGCWGSEGSYSIAGLEDDIDAAFRWFRAQPNVDERRIVVVGHSLGGYHALRLATEAAQGTGIDLRGVVALCPLVATDSAGVPLEQSLATEFAKMLKDVSPETLQAQWASLIPVKQRLIGMRSRDEKLQTQSKLPLLIMTGDEDPLFAPGYYIDHLQAPLQSAHVKSLMTSKWVRLRYGDHALCRYRRDVVRRIVRFSLKCVGSGARLDLMRVGRTLLSWRGLLYPVPFMFVIATVTGFIGGQFCATPEGQEHARAKRQELEARRRQAAPGPKPLLRL